MTKAVAQRLFNLQYQLNNAVAQVYQLEYQAKVKDSTIQLMETELRKLGYDNEDLKKLHQQARKE